MPPEEVEQLTVPETQPAIVDHQETVLDLFAIEYDKNKNDIVPEKLQSLVNDIMQDPPKPPENHDQEKIGDLLKKGKIGEALTQTIDLISSILFKSKKKSGLDTFKKYNMDYTNIPDTPLQEQINWLQSKVKKSWISINKKLRFTYALSRAKDEKNKREKTDISPFEALAKNIQAGDILLMNKDGKSETFTDLLVDNTVGKIATGGLQIASNSIWTHTVMVTKVSGNSIEITHASGRKEDMKVLKEDLYTYTKKYTAMDICVLQQPPESRQKSIDYAYSLLGESYDNKSATKQAVLGKNEKDNAYNCGELVADSLLAANPVIFQELENKTFPSDFLVNNYILPSYMTTIVS